MPGVWDLAWHVYQNSGPALQFGLILAVGYGWKYHVGPRMDRLETIQADHQDSLQDRALDHRERDVLLDQAHNRLDEADEARQSLRERLRRIERRMDRNHPGDEEMDRKMGNRQTADD